MNEGLKKYADHNKLVKAAGGVNSYNSKVYMQGYNKGVGDKLISIGEGAAIASGLFILVGKWINKRKKKKIENAEKELNGEENNNDEIVLTETQDKNIEKKEDHIEEKRID